MLVEKGKPDGTWTYGVSCIEFIEFEKFGIDDGPLFPIGTTLTLLLVMNLVIFSI